ncbi:MAG: hypothetical protein ACK5RL_15085 [Acidimicrobiales bacterium]
MSPAIGHLWHLATRFAGSLSPAAPSEPDEAWARRQLTPGELEVWAAMTNPDRRHAIDVARRTVDSLGERADRPVVAAALLHDSGKTVSGLGTFARVGATVIWAVVDDDLARHWADGAPDTVTGRIQRRLGQYRCHPEIGARILAEAGSDPLTVAWTAEHHQAPGRGSLDPVVACALKDADDD